METEEETGGAGGAGEERMAAALRAAEIKQRVEGNESAQVEMSKDERAVTEGTGRAEGAGDELVET